MDDDEGYESDDDLEDFILETYTVECGECGKIENKYDIPLEQASKEWSNAGWRFHHGHNTLTCSKNCMSKL